MTTLETLDILRMEISLLKDKLKRRCSQFAKVRLYSEVKHKRLRSELQRCSNLTLIDEIGDTYNVLYTGVYGNVLFNIPADYPFVPPIPIGKPIIKFEDWSPIIILEQISLAILSADNLQSGE